MREAAVLGRLLNIRRSLFPIYSLKARAYAAYLRGEEGGYFMSRGRLTQVLTNHSMVNPVKRVLLKRILLKRVLSSIVTD